MSEITCTVCKTKVDPGTGSYVAGDSKTTIQMGDMDRYGDWLILQIVVCPKCVRDSIKRRCADALKL